MVRMLWNLRQFCFLCTYFFFSRKKKKSFFASHSSLCPQKRSVWFGVSQTNYSHHEWSKERRKKRERSFSSKLWVLEILLEEHSMWLWLLPTLLWMLENSYFSPAPNRKIVGHKNKFSLLKYRKCSKVLIVFHPMNVHACWWRIISLLFLCASLAGPLPA